MKERNAMIERLLMNEWAHFKKLPANARLMLYTSSISIFAMSVLSIFVFAFILRGTTDINQVMTFQFALFCGLPLAFILNRHLVGRSIGCPQLYAAGIVLCGLTLLLMTLLPALTRPWIAGLGLLMGLATGLHWANRFYLVLVCTHDTFRNYFFGIESFFLCISSVVMPAGVGMFIAGWGGEQAHPEACREAYQWVGAAMMALLLLASSFLFRISCAAEVPARLCGKHPPLWKAMLLLAALKGTVQIFLMTAPSILIMRVLGGKEDALGLTQSAGAILSAFMLYWLGRRLPASRRVAVLAFSLVLYAAGAVVNAWLFNRFSALLFMACQLLALPLLDFAYSPIFMQVLDAVAKEQPATRYSYIVSHELGTFAGRLLGAAFFITSTLLSSGDWAFRIVLALMALVQLLCWPVAHRLQRMLS